MGFVPRRSRVQDHFRIAIRCPYLERAISSQSDVHFFAIARSSASFHLRLREQSVFAEHSAAQNKRRFAQAHVSNVNYASPQGHLQCKRDPANVQYTTSMPARLRKP